MKAKGPIEERIACIDAKIVRLREELAALEQRRNALLERRKERRRDE